VKLNDLKPAAGSKKTRKRVGRGLGSGRGKTAGRGQKGQKSRAGFSQGAGWEGGRSRLVMRLPKRGFSRVGTVFQLVNLVDLNLFEAGTTVGPDALRERGVIRHVDRPIKLLGDGELEIQGLTVQVDACSRSAARAVTAAGGTVEVAGGAPDADAVEAEPEGAAEREAAQAAEPVAAAEAQAAEPVAAEPEAAEVDAAEVDAAEAGTDADSTTEADAERAEDADEETT
jgi:large subunit ribosomal protein L15